MLEEDFDVCTEGVCSLKGKSFDFTASKPLIRLKFVKYYTIFFIAKILLWKTHLRICEHEEICELCEV